MVYLLLGSTAVSLYYKLMRSKLVLSAFPALIFEKGRPVTLLGSFSSW